MGKAGEQEAVVITVAIYNILALSPAPCMAIVIHESQPHYQSLCKQTVLLREVGSSAHVRSTESLVVAAQVQADNSQSRMRVISALEICNLCALNQGLASVTAS